ncbi:MAG: hypothetical protein J6U23_05025 [Clostridiales bacterium]|nr:hypothetical protein [Clostridiales bacterium]
MSKNQEIEFMHKLTQEPYSVCRSRLKKHNWSLLGALTDIESLQDISNLSRKIIDTFPKRSRSHIFRVRELATAIQIIKSRSIDVIKHADSNLCQVVANIGPEVQHEDS